LRCAASSGARYPGHRPCRHNRVESLGIHGRAKQRHIVLPADHTADLPQRCLKYGQSRTVAKSPDQPLHRCWHKLAVFSHQFTLRREKQYGTIEGPDIPFNHTDSQNRRRCLLQKLLSFLFRDPALRWRFPSNARNRTVLPENAGPPWRQNQGPWDRRR